MQVSEAREHYIQQRDEKDVEGDIRRSLKFIKDSLLISQMNRYTSSLRKVTFSFPCQLFVQMYDFIHTLDDTLKIYGSHRHLCVIIFYKQKQFRKTVENTGLSKW